MGNDCKILRWRCKSKEIRSNPFLYWVLVSFVEVQLLYVHCLNWLIRGDTYCRDRLRQQRIWQKNYGKAMQDNRNRQHGPQRSRDASVRVQESWTVLEDMDYVRLTKLNLPLAIEGKDLWVDMIISVWPTMLCQVGVGGAWYCGLYGTRLKQAIEIFKVTLKALWLWKAILSKCCCHEHLWREQLLHMYVWLPSINICFDILYKLTKQLGEVITSCHCRLYTWITLHSCVMLFATRCNLSTNTGTVFPRC